MPPAGKPVSSCWCHIQMHRTSDFAQIGPGVSLKSWSFKVSQSCTRPNRSEWTWRTITQGNTTASCYDSVYRFLRNKWDFLMLGRVLDLEFSFCTVQSDLGIHGDCYQNPYPKYPKSTDSEICSEGQHPTQEVIWDHLPGMNAHCLWGSQNGGYKAKKLLVFAWKLQICFYACTRHPQVHRSLLRAAGQERWKWLPISIHVQFYGFIIWKSLKKAKEFYCFKTGTCIMHVAKESKQKLPFFWKEY